MSTGKAARELGVGLSTLQRWANKGSVTPAFRTPGGHYKWDLDDLRQQLRDYRPEGEPMIDPNTPVRPPIVAAVVISNKGVLITRRHDGKPLWGFVSGEVESGESPADAAIREVKEEAGLEIKVSHVIDENPDHKITHRHMIYLACRPYSSAAVFVGDTAELAEVTWASLAEAKEKMPTMYPSVKEHLETVLG